MRDETKARVQTLLVSIGCYVAACALPALVFHNRAYSDVNHFVWQRYRSVSGINLLVGGLLFGWIRFNFTALANLPLWLSWILFARGNYAAARTCAIVALVMSLETLQLVFQPYLYDEGAAVKGYLVAPHVGCLCWLASMAVILFMSRAMEREVQRLTT